MPGPGGKSTLDAIDLAARPWVPHSGWPLDPARLRACYERAAALLDRPPPAFYDAPASEPDDGLRLDGATSARWCSTRTPGRCASAPCCASGCARPTGSTSSRWPTSPRCCSTTSAPVWRGSTSPRSTAGGSSCGPRVVLLACGAVENARLLLASRSRRPAGLGNAHDVVGRYFQDHPKGFTGVLAVAPGATRLPASGYWPGRFTARAAHVGASGSPSTPSAGPACSTATCASSPRCSRRARRHRGAQAGGPGPGAGSRPVRARGPGRRRPRSAAPRPVPAAQRGADRPRCTCAASSSRSPGPAAACGSPTGATRSAGRWPRSTGTCPSSTAGRCGCCTRPSPTASAATGSATSPSPGRRQRPPGTGCPTPRTTRAPPGWAPTPAPR